MSSLVEESSVPEDRAAVMRKKRTNESSANRMIENDKLVPAVALLSIPLHQFNVNAGGKKFDIVVFHIHTKDKCGSVLLLLSNAKNVGCAKPT